MAGRNFWQAYESAGHIDLADADGNDVRVELCRDRRGRLGIVNEGPAFGPTAGDLSADFGPNGQGFRDVAAAREYAEKRTY